MKKKIHEYKKVTNWFEYTTPEEVIELQYEGFKGLKSLRCTKNHKIYTTNRGYVEAQFLTLKDDIVIDGPGLCPICNKEFSNKPALCTHFGSHNVPLEKKQQQALTMTKSKNHNNPAARKLSSDRMKKSNPMYNQAHVDKAKESNKLTWENTSEEDKIRRITIFQNAPKRGVRKGPSSLEKRIISLNIPNLIYTGNGETWLKSGARYLNPDFSVKGKSKVVEVGDIEYWHTLEDVKERVVLFKNIGIDCLYYTSEQLKTLTDSELFNQIEEFING